MVDATGLKGKCGILITYKQYVRSSASAHLIGDSKALLQTLYYNYLSELNYKVDIYFKLLVISCRKVCDR
jgi:hypothetical protein